MAQLFPAPLDLAEDSGLLSSTYMVPYSSLPLSPRAPSTSFWSLRAPSTHMVHIYICRQNTPAHKIKPF